MFRFRRALVSAREHITGLLPTCRKCRISGRADFYLHPSQSVSSLPISPQEAAAGLAPASFEQTVEAGQQVVSIALTTFHKGPATPTLTAEAAHVSKFSHGTGLLVYVNGALVSAASVALEFNIATLKAVKQLPIDEVETVGAYLGAAFATTGSCVDVAWAEVSSNTERDWREAEQHWEVFSGGPYQAFPLEACNEEFPSWNPIYHVTEQ